jgi:ribonuclease E
MAVMKRRAEGTPCNKENFEAWKEKFDKEMEDLREKEEEEESQKDKLTKKGAIKKLDEEELIESRSTGFEQFSQKLGLANLDALEKAAEEAENEEGDVEDLNVDELDVDEDLFDEDDDLDDLDFDSGDDDSDDDDEEELDI